jgi:hypothetical protein
MRNLVPAFIVVVMASCASGSAPSTCIPGASTQCTCADGKAGAQTCGNDGTYGTCSCVSATGSGGATGNGGAGGSTGTGGAAGAGGASGHGGSVGSGGATGAGGATGSGGTSGAGGQTTYGQFTVTYDGTLTKTLSTCYSCTANYSLALGVGGAAYNFAVDTGITTVTVGVKPAASGGNEVEVGLGEDNPMVSARLRGTYLTTPDYVAVGGSCVNFSMVDLSLGGGMAGSLNCTLTGGNDTTPHTAVVQGSFTAVFP